MTVLYLALAVLLVIDWRQTLVIAQPGGWYERNPVIAWLIARFGSAGVHAWFALCGLALAGAMYSFQSYALWIAGVGCAMELVCVVNNYRLGIRS